MRRKIEGLLLECTHPDHVGPRMLPRGWFGRVGRGEGKRHAHCRVCRRAGKSAANAKRRGAGVTKVRAGIVTLLYRQQGQLCAICGLMMRFGDFHVDHKIPVSRGGRHEVKNLQLVHARCNLSKSNKL